nr:MAG TPA: hypothetical protein [Caudoviricetes sp.]
MASLLVISLQAAHALVSCFAVHNYMKIYKVIFLTLFYIFL